MFHQEPAKWDVVESFSVEPIRVVVEDEGATIIRMASSEIVGNYVFDMATTQAAHSPSAGSSRRSSASTSKHTPTSRRCSMPLRHNSNSRALPLGAPQLDRTISPEVDSDAEHNYTRHSDQPHATSTHVKSSPKLTRLSSALSFFRTSRNRSSTPSTDSDHDDSHSGTSDGESDSSTRSWANQLRLRASRADAVAAAAAAPPPPAYKKSDLKKALIFARGEIVKQVEASGKNALVVEGWAVTVLRQGSRYRLQIEYTARPAVVSFQDEPRLRRPPYLEVIDS